MESSQDLNHPQDIKAQDFCARIQFGLQKLCNAYNSAREEVDCELNTLNLERQKLDELKSDQKISSSLVKKRLVRNEEDTVEMMAK